MQAGGRTPVSSSPEVTVGTRGQGNEHGWTQALHGLAGLLLLVFAASHGVFLTLPDSRLGLDNLVFPFLSNWGVSFCAGLLELGVGLACLRWRGQPWINGLILTLVAVLVWYRWALRFTGGVGCNCLGILGKLLGLNRTQEAGLSWFGLWVLVLSTVPWLGKQLWRVLQVCGGRIALAALLGSPIGLHAELNLQVWGTVTERDYNPRTGEPYTNQVWQNTFLVTLAGEAWDVRVTNQHHPHWWARQSFDGTNSYALRPARGVFVSEASYQPSTNLATASLIRSPYPVPVSAGVLGDAMVSLTYGWSPATFRTNQAGMVVVPIPWTSVRNNPGAWGYQWRVHGWQDGRFLRGVDVVRDSKLDEPTSRELFRMEMDYPETRADYNAYQNVLVHRKSEPDGSLRGRYTVTGWFQARGVTFPRSSRLEVFHATPTNWPARVFELEASGFQFLDEAPQLIPEVAVPTEVADYRYKRWNSRRIFKYATYTLELGESWPGDQEPALLAAAEDWLKRGRPFTRFADDRKRWVAWLLLGLVLSPMVIWGMRLKRQNKPPSKQAL